MLTWLIGVVQDVVEKDSEWWMDETWMRNIKKCCFNQLQMTVL